MQLISYQFGQTKSLDCGRHFDFPVGGRVVKYRHFVAPTYLGKVTEVFPLTPSALEMAFKRSVWGTFTPSITI